MLSIPTIKRVVFNAFIPYLTGERAKSYKQKEIIYMTYYMCKKFGHRLKDIADHFGITNTKVYYGNTVVEDFLDYDKTYKILTEAIRLELDALIFEQEKLDDMTIKTNKSQLDGLVLLLSEVVNDNKPTNLAEDFIYHHVKTAYNKMRVKSELDYLPRAGYSISLTDQEARAMYLFLQQVYIPADRYPYEVIQLTSMTNEIYQEYGSRIKAIGQ